MNLFMRTQSAASYSGHSGQSPLVLNHVERRYKDKVGSVPRSQLVGSYQLALTLPIKFASLSDVGSAPVVTADWLDGVVDMSVPRSRQESSDSPLTNQDDISQ
jgi:hypothetical protein